MSDEQADWYPPAGFYFRVNVEGIQGRNEGSFQEVSGLNRKMGVEEVKEGGENRFVHRLPSPPKFDNLLLKRGMVTGSALIQWVEAAVEQFQFSPRTVVVILMDEDSNPLVSWQFSNAYPVSYVIAPFKAQESEAVLETVELCFDYFNRVK